MPIPVTKNSTGQKMTGFYQKLLGEFNKECNFKSIGLNINTMTENKIQITKFSDFDKQQNLKD